MVNNTYTERSDLFCFRGLKIIEEIGPFKTTVNGKHQTENNGKPQTVNNSKPLTTENRKP